MSDPNNPSGVDSDIIKPEPFGGATSLVGSIAVIVGIIFFGTQAVFVKSKQIIEARVDPFLVVCYFSVGVFFCGALLALVMSSAGLEGGFAWTIDGLYASLVYAPGNILLLWSARTIGVGLCTGVVSSTASVTGFFTGVFILDNPVSSWAKALVGLALLILGAIGMSLTRVPSVQQRLAPELFEDAVNETEGQPYKLMDDASLQGMEMEDASLRKASLIENRPSDVFAHPKNPSMRPSHGGHRQMSIRCSEFEAVGKVQEFHSAGLIRGLATSAAAGAFLGCQGVPLTNDAGVPLRDAATFMMMQLLWTVVLLVPLLRIKYTETIARGEHWNWHRETALGSAMAGGVCFSIAFGGQLFAILALTASVGLPLTQLNLVVAGMWGTFYYGELKGRVLIACFFFAAAIAVAGAPLI
jgi:drug/metabolite transporter (DMT)-like permease